jgi:hypothetical protein
MADMSTGVLQGGAMNRVYIKTLQAVGANHPPGSALNVHADVPLSKVVVGAPTPAN